MLQTKTRVLEPISQDQSCNELVATLARRGLGLPLAQLNAPPFVTPPAMVCQLTSGSGGGKPGGAADGGGVPPCRVAVEDGLQDNRAWFGLKARPKA